VQDDAGGFAQGVGRAAEPCDGLGFVAGRGAVEITGGDPGADDHFSGQGQQPVHGRRDLGQDLGHRAAGLGGRDPLGELGEVAHGCVTVAVGGGQHVQGGVEVDAVAGGEQGV
jgi:hypothetical protein